MARILVLEDDPLSALVFERVLTRMGGHRAIMAQDSDEAASLARQGELDLIVLVVSQPGLPMNGREAQGLAFSRALKTDPSTARIPILLATAHAMNGDRERFLEESLADAYISKPIVDHHHFCALVHDMMLQAERPAL